MNPWWRFFILILAALLMASVNDMAIFLGIFFVLPVNLSILRYIVPCSDNAS